MLAPHFSPWYTRGLITAYSISRHFHYMRFFFSFARNADTRKSSGDMRADEDFFKSISLRCRSAARKIDLIIIDGHIASRQGAHIGFWLPGIGDTEYSLTYDDRLLISKHVISLISIYVEASPFIARLWCYFDAGWLMPRAMPKNAATFNADAWLLSTCRQHLYSRRSTALLTTISPASRRRYKFIGRSRAIGRLGLTYLACKADSCHFGAITGSFSRAIRLIR